MGVWFEKYNEKLEVFTAGKEYCLILSTFFFTYTSRGFAGLSAIDFFERGWEGRGGVSRGKNEGSFLKQPSALAHRGIKLEYSRQKSFGIYILFRNKTKIKHEAINT